MKKSMFVTLFALGALVLVPTESSASNIVCNPKHYCFAPSWGCMPCRYMRAKEVFDVKVTAVGNDIKRTQGQINTLNRKLRALKTKALQLSKARARHIDLMKKSVRKPESQRKLTR